MTLHPDSVTHFGFEHSDLGLSDSEIGHLDVESVEVDSLDTLLHIFRQLALADSLESHEVGDGAELVELSEQNVDFIQSIRVIQETIPVGSVWKHSAIIFEVSNDFREVPGEGEDIGVLLLTEDHIDSLLFALGFDVDLGGLRGFLLLDACLGGEEAGGLRQEGRSRQTERSG